MSSLVKNLRKKLWRKSLRWYISNKHKFASLHRDRQMNEAQILASNILKRLISKHGVELLYVPDTRAIFIKYNGVIAQMEDTPQGGYVSILNGKYYYNVFLPTIHYKSVVAVFNAKIESRKRSTEREIANHLQRNLKSILEEIDQL